MQLPHHATITPWVDPLVDARGHDPRGAYVERFWLSVIGPTATWIMRRFADEFDRQPDGFTIDLAHTATSMGLSFAKGANSPFGRAIHRCVMFGLAQPAVDGLSVRRRFPTVALRHLSRLPDDVQQSHAEWARRTASPARADVEAKLRAAGVPPQLAVRASEATALAA
ncbi:MAG: hypothetical protein HKN41_01840 [Ilumatobacter sp.]|nr:hypothetical protein [Ilumatobacter sp.]